MQSYAVFGIFCFLQVLQYNVKFHYIKFIYFHIHEVHKYNVITLLCKLYKKKLKRVWILVYSLEFQHIDFYKHCLK
jgi:hypothetical protein